MIYNTNSEVKLIARLNPSMYYAATRLTIKTATENISTEHAY